MLKLKVWFHQVASTVSMAPLDSRDIKLKYLNTKVSKSTNLDEFKYWSQELAGEIR